VGSELAIYFWLNLRYLEDDAKWFTIRDVAKAVDLSIDRTRRVLSLLALKGEIKTRIDGFKNVYRFR